jgi:hypothetical protein
MRFCCETFAHVAPLDDVLGVVKGQKPREPQTESLGDKGSAAGMMPAGSFMDVPKKGNTVFGRYASLEDSYFAAFAEFSLDYREGLGASHYLAMVDGVFGQLAS